MPNFESNVTDDVQTQFCEWVRGGLYAPSEVEEILQDLAEDTEELPPEVCEALRLNIGTPYMYAAAVLRAAHAVADHGYTAQWVIDDIQRMTALLRYCNPANASSEI